MSNSPTRAPRLDLLLKTFVIVQFSFAVSQNSLAQDTPPAADAGALEAGAVPSEYPATRYDKIRVKSPFEFELAKPPSEKEEDPFQDLVLAGYAGSANRVTVYLTNTKTQERITVSPDIHKNTRDTGFRVISVDRGRTLRTSTATLEKNGKTKQLSFDSKALSSMVGGNGAAAPIGGRPPGTPGLPGAQGQPVIRPTGAGAAAGARPLQQAYQAPQPFISGQGAGNNNAQAANNGGAAGAPNQTGGSQANQQLVNQLINNNAQLNQAQPTVAPPQTGASPAAGNGPSRRRVVLPTQP